MKSIIYARNIPQIKFNAKITKFQLKGMYINKIHISKMPQFGTQELRMRAIRIFSFAKIHVEEKIQFVKILKT